MLLKYRPMFKPTVDEIVSKAGARNLAEVLTGNAKSKQSKKNIHIGMMSLSQECFCLAPTFHLSIE